MTVGASAAGPARGRATVEVMRSFALGLLLCVALGGCGSSDPGDAGDLETGAASPTDLVPVPGSPPVPHEVAADQVGTEFTPGASLVMAQSTPFEAWTALPGNRIAVHFVTGTPECYGADATVEETEETVVVTVRTGTLESAKDKSCIMIAVYGTMELQLAAPVGTRTVLNGT